MSEDTLGHGENSKLMVNNGGSIRRPSTDILDHSDSSAGEEEVPAVQAKVDSTEMKEALGLALNPKFPVVDYNIYEDAVDNLIRKRKLLQLQFHGLKQSRLIKKYSRILVQVQGW